jgi:hypothetical protein
MTNPPTASEPFALAYTKPRWQTAWTEAPLLEPCQRVDAAAPSHSTARFCFRFGQAMLPAIGSRQPDTAPATIPRPSLLGSFVRMDVDGLGPWYGVIPDNAENRAGVINGVALGEQMLTAYGLTWLLDHGRPVHQSRVILDGSPVTINRAIPFNGGTDGRQQPNRVAAANFDPSARVFTDRVESSAVALWTAADAIRYLLKEFPPTDQNGTAKINFELAPGADAFLRYRLPFVAYHNETLWQIINRLIDRRRGLGWHAYVDDQAGKVLLKVWSQNVQPIVLPSGNGTIPRNPDTVAFDFDSAVNIRRAEVTETLLTKYQQVVCEGERSGSVFTLRPGTGFEADWTTAEVDEYNDGATTETGFSTLGDPEKEAYNNDARTADELAHVFSSWRIDPTWNGRADTEPADATQYWAFPLLDDDGNEDTTAAAPVHRAGLRIATYMPMRPNVDYTGTVEAETSETNDDRDSDFLPPFVLYQLAEINNNLSADDEGWTFAERLNQSVDAGAEARQYKYSVDVRVRENAPGLVLQTIGAPQHFIARDLFVADDTYEDIPTEEGVDSDSWLATIYVQQDDFARGVYPPAEDLPQVDLLQVLVLRVPDAYLDFLVPETVVGVRYGGVLTSSTNWGILRDDRPRLRDIARLAFAWYGVPRRILGLTFREVVAGFNVGDLVTHIGQGTESRDINTAITQVAYDLRAGVTNVSTSFGELDFVGIV